MPLEVLLEQFFDGDNEKEDDDLLWEEIRRRAYADVTPFVLLSESTASWRMRMHAVPFIFRCSEKDKKIAREAVLRLVDDKSKPVAVIAMSYMGDSFRDGNVLVDPRRAAMIAMRALRSNRTRLHSIALRLLFMAPTKARLSLIREIAFGTHWSMAIRRQAQEHLESLLAKPHKTKHGTIRPSRGNGSRANHSG